MLNGINTANTGTRGQRKTPMVKNAANMRQNVHGVKEYRNDNLYPIPKVMPTATADMPRKAADTLGMFWK